VTVRESPQIAFFDPASPPDRIYIMFEKFSNGLGLSRGAASSQEVGSPFELHCL
jgi:hypothetical protein